MTDLTSRITAALDEQQRLAEAAKGNGVGVWHQPSPDYSASIEDEEGWVVVYNEGSPTDDQAAHIVANDPSSVLRRVAAQRRTLERHPEPVQHPDDPVYRITCTGCRWVWPCEEIKDLADAVGVDVTSPVNEKEIAP